MPVDKPVADSIDVAKSLAKQLDELGHEYSLGGALALGFWSTPRGTMDVDLTLFLSKDQPADCIYLLQDLGCQFGVGDALGSFREHGFAQVEFAGIRVDVFLPSIPFYDFAKSRRRRLMLEEQPIWVWDAETLTVFKMMFFREKDLVDLKQILLTQLGSFDRVWVRQQLEEIFGRRDPRLPAWDRLTTEIPVA